MTWRPRPPVMGEDWRSVILWYSLYHPENPRPGKVQRTRLSDPKPQERASYNWYAEAHIKVVHSIIDLDRRGPSTVYLIYTYTYLVLWFCFVYFVCFGPRIFGMCNVKWSFLENVLLHFIHLYGFSPVWHLMCNVKCSFHGNVLLHSIHFVTCIAP